MPTKPQILKRWPVLHSRLFRAEAMELEFSNGVRRTYERLLGSKPAVLVIPLLDDDRVVLVREYAAGTNDYQLALPKGRVDKGESFEEAADRELREEAGYGAKRLERLKALTQSPNYMEHSTQLVLAQDLFESSAEGDEPEPLEVEIARLSQLETLLKRPDFSEARSIAALFMVRAHLST